MNNFKCGVELYYKILKLTEGAEQAYFIPDHTPYCKDGDYEKHQAFTCP